MTIVVEPLHTISDLRSAVALQKAAPDTAATSIWSLSHLVHVQQSGGLMLGAREVGDDSHALSGVLVDLMADVDGYPARRTVSWMAEVSRRNQGIGTALREAERRTLHNAGVDLVFWDLDPLDSTALHIALNKLGGILTATEVAPKDEPTDSALSAPNATRVRVEWWIDSPRVVSKLVHGSTLPHQHVGLHEMVVLTKTTTLQTGVRGLLECDQQATSDHVLVEIPESIAKVQARDPAAAIQWRERIQPVLTHLFHQGYQGVGLIHEGGRSFLVMKKGTRRTELGATR